MNFLSSDSKMNRRPADKQFEKNIRTGDKSLVHIPYTAYGTVLLLSLVMPVEIVSYTALASIPSMNDEVGFDNDVTIRCEVYGLY